MASTITAAPLVVKITETLNLNGKEQGSTHTKSLSGIKQWTRRIASVTTTESTLLEFAAAQASGDNTIKYDEAKVKYVRITNLESDAVTLAIVNSDDDEVASFLLAGGCSYVLFDVAAAFGTTDANTTTPTADGDIGIIKADASTGTVDVEVIVATT